MSCVRRLTSLKACRVADENKSHPQTSIQNEIIPAFLFQPSALSTLKLSMFDLTFIQTRHPFDTKYSTRSNNINMKKKSNESTRCFIAFKSKSKKY